MHRGRGSNSSYTFRWKIVDTFSVFQIKRGPRKCSSRCITRIHWEASPWDASRHNDPWADYDSQVAPERNHPSFNDIGLVKKQVWDFDAKENSKLHLKEIIHDLMIFSFEENKPKFEAIGIVMDASEVLKVLFFLQILSAVPSIKGLTEANA